MPPEVNPRWPAPWRIAVLISITWIETSALTRPRRVLGAGRHGTPIQSTVRSGRFQNTKLRERRDSVVEADFLRDLAVLDPEYRRTREVHLPARRLRQRSCEKIVE